MRTIKDILKERYDPLKVAGEGTTMFGLPAKDMSREDLLVLLGFIGEQKRQDEAIREREARFLGELDALSRAGEGY